MHTRAQALGHCDRYPVLRSGRRYLARLEPGEGGEKDRVCAVDQGCVCHNITWCLNCEVRSILDGMEEFRLIGGADGVKVGASFLQITALWTIRKADGSRDVIELRVRLTGEDDLAPLLLKAVRGSRFGVIEHAHIRKNQCAASECR